VLLESACVTLDVCVKLAVQSPREVFNSALKVRHTDEHHWIGLTPFDTNWKEGSGATPLTTQDLFFGDAISVPTALTIFPGNQHFRFFGNARQTG